MLTIIVFTIAMYVIILILLLYIERRERAWSVERKELTSRIDTLMEAIAHDDGKRLSFGRPARTAYEMMVEGMNRNRDRAFSKGFQSDKPATPAAPGGTGGGTK